MKKVLILLAGLLAAGAVSGFVLYEMPELEQPLPQSAEAVAVMKNEIKAAKKETAPKETTAPKQTTAPKETTAPKQTTAPKSETAAQTEPEQEAPKKEKAPKDPMEVSFSAEAGFYDKDISVTLSCEKSGAQIYYTTDGNDPTTSSKKYTSPIPVTSRTKVTATTIRAISVSGSETSPIYTSSYITGKNVFDRFDPTTLVFVLSSDEHNLYDYYDGIATEGHIRDEYINSDRYRGDEADWELPGNYSQRGRESERDMYVEAFTSDGKRIISQAAGGRVAGAASRSQQQKSWRLFARNSYSEGNGKFKYPFFTGAADAYGNAITRYDRITLRNNANDREFAAVRDELSMTLSKKAGFPDTQEVRPAAVFLNGQYYGFSWLHEAYCESYLQATYGGSKDNFRIIGDKEKDITSGDKQSIADWNKVLKLAENGLTDDKKFAEFCKLVDIDNFMMYYAIELYIDNKDWPGNNFKAWKYCPSEGETVTSGYLDGKWRFMLFDAEYAWGLYGAGYKCDTLTAVLTGKHMQGRSLLLNAVLEREDMKQKFAYTMCDLIGGAFSPESAMKTLESLVEDSKTECDFALNNGFTSQWANQWTFEDSRKQIRSFAVMRPDVMKKSVSKQFGYSAKYYKVSLVSPSGAKAFLGSQTSNGAGTLSAEYFTACDVPISVTPLPGYKFDRWEINGRKYTDANVTITNKMADKNGAVEILLYMKKSDEQRGVYVSEIYAGGKGDWIELYNPSDKAVKLSGLYLSDDKDDLKKWALPDDKIKPHSTYTAACKNNKESSALKKHRTNFSLKAGETLYFTDEQGNILSKAAIVEMNEKQSLTRRIDGTYTVGAVSENSHIEE